MHLALDVGNTESVIGLFICDDVVQLDDHSLKEIALVWRHSFQVPSNFRRDPKLSWALE